MNMNERDKTSSLSTNQPISSNLTNPIDNKTYQEKKLNVESLKLKLKSKLELLQKNKLQIESKVDKNADIQNEAPKKGKVLLSFQDNSLNQSISFNIFKELENNISNKKIYPELDDNDNKITIHNHSKIIEDKNESSVPEIDPFEEFMNQIDSSSEINNLNEMEDIITYEDLNNQNVDIQMTDDVQNEKIFKERLLTAFKKDNLSDEDEYFHEDIRFENESNQDIILISTRNTKKDLKPVDHSKIEYSSFRKNLFVVPQELAKLSFDEVQNLRKDLGKIVVKGKDCPPPIINFHQCGLSDPILEIIKKEGYQEPFPIQCQAIPAIMSGRDTIGIARTGSGKTLAFTLPMLRHILDQPPLKSNDGPIALVIAPTRELAVQIQEEIDKFASILNLTTMCGVGGAPISEQISSLKRGAHIIVCTPGRMIELLCANRGRVTNLKRVTYVCLDEADRMFDLGFGPQVTRIIGNIRPDKQIVMFSATFPKPLEALARSSMSQPLEILAGGRSIASKNVRQFVEIRKDKKEKFYRLLQILGQWQNIGRILIFVDRQSECGVLYKDLTNAGYDVLVQHGGMDQLDRECNMKTFKTEENSILIATSVLSRGLDVKGLELVINYDCPNHYEDYVHRVGRTGRAGKEGTAYTFITPEESMYAPNLVRALKLSENAVPQDLQQLSDEYIAKSGKTKKNLVGYRGHGYKFDNTEVNQKKMEIQRQLVSLGVVDAEAFEQPKKEQEKEIETTKVEDEYELVDPQEAVRKAREYAMNLALQHLQQKEKRIFTAEIDINDLPQKVRSDITSKEYTFQLNDRYGVTVSARGTFVPPGNPIPEGGSKLHLLLEGHSYEKVEGAKIKIEKAIRELASGFANLPQKHNVGRYSVVL